MIRDLIARIRRYFRAMGLRADIAGYEDDLHTIRAIGQSGSMAESINQALLDQARYELYLCTRKPGVAVTN